MKLISSIVNESDFKTHQEYYKARFLVVLGGVFLVLGAMYGAVYIAVYDYPAGGAILFSTAVINMGNIYLLYRLKSIRLSGNISAFLLFLSLMVITYSSGGIDAHANVWFATLIMLTFMVIGTASGFFWSGAVLIAFLVMYNLSAAGHQFPEILANEAESFRNLITFTGAMFTIMLLAYFFQNIRDRAFNLVDETLSTTVRTLENTREQMMESARFTNDKAQHVKSYAHEVSNNLNDVDSDIRQFNDSIQQVEQNVSEADEMSDRAYQITRDTEGHISNLKSRSEEIGKVVDVINSVATQVNLLALNASVEAVRAGEAGSGFSIVADEIKSLANKTSENTHQIEDTIKRVQEEIGAIIDQIGSLDDVINDVSTKQKDISGALKVQSQTTSNMVERVNTSSQHGQEINKMLEDLAQSASSLMDEISEKSEMQN